MFYFNKYKAYVIRKIFDLISFFYKPERITLEKVLAYCSKNIEFYENRGDSIETYEFIDKYEVKRNFDAFLKKKKGVSIRNAGVTSGTTGTPGKFFRDIRSMATEQYFQNLYFEWKGKYRVTFRGEKIFPMDYQGHIIFKTVPLIGEMYVSSFHINDQTLFTLVERLQGIKHKVLWAYPSSAYMLAEYCLRKGIRLPFEVVATSSESLMPFQVEAIEKAFGGKMKDWYGQAERVAALTRCPWGHYHQPDNYSYVEYIPLEGKQFEIVGTTLHNQVMPLVRYMIHDIVEISKENCPCGNLGKNIVKIHGRTTSYIELPLGKVHEAPLAFLFKTAKNVIEAQIVQKQDKQITIRVVKGDGYCDENESELHKVICHTIPADMYTLEYVDRIQRDAQGKFRYVINENLSEIMTRQERET